jgi:putative endonuclease
VLYAGVTSDLINRLKQHKARKYRNSFSSRYNLNKLVYFEMYDNIGEAIKREKQIKNGSRKRKVDLILSMNPEWNDLREALEG